MEEKMKRLILATSLIALSCSTQVFAFEQENQIVVADNRMVEGCLQVATFEAPAGYSMVGTPEPVAGFKSEVMKKANEMGATHVSWSYESSQLRQTIYGKAYKCEGMKNVAKYRQ